MWQRGNHTGYFVLIINESAPTSRAMDPVLGRKDKLIWGYSFCDCFKQTTFSNVTKPASKVKRNEVQGTETQKFEEKKNCTKQNRPNTRLTKQELNPINRHSRVPWRTAKESEFPQRMRLPPVRKTSIPEGLKKSCSHRRATREHWGREVQIRSHFSLCRQMLELSLARQKRAAHSLPCTPTQPFATNNSGHRNLQLWGWPSLLHL